MICAVWRTLACGNVQFVACIECTIHQKCRGCRSPSQLIDSFLLTEQWALSTAGDAWSGIDRGIYGVFGIVQLQGGLKWTCGVHGCAGSRLR